jgi:hypothetical protein
LFQDGRIKVGKHDNGYSLKGVLPTAEVVETLRQRILPAEEPKFRYAPRHNLFLIWIFAAPERESMSVIMPLPLSLAFTFFRSFSFFRAVFGFVFTLTLSLYFSFFFLFCATERF